MLQVDGESQPLLGAGDDLLVQGGSDEKGRMQLTYRADLVYAACMATLCMVEEGVHVCASSAASVVQAGSAQHIQHDTPLTCRTARGEDGLTPLMYSMCSRAVGRCVFRALVGGDGFAEFFSSSSSLLLCPSFARQRAGPDLLSCSSWVRSHSGRALCVL